MNTSCTMTGVQAVSKTCLWREGCTDSAASLFARLWESAGDAPKAGGAAGPRPRKALSA